MDKLGTMCYYRVGKDRKGEWKKCKEVIAEDKTRKEFVNRLRTDEVFRTDVLQLKDTSIEKYIEEYEARAACPGPNIKDDEVLTCTALYKLGHKISNDKKTTKIRKDTNDEVIINNEDVCVYDDSHDAVINDIPEDVCRIRAFSEAALLKIMRRRLIEKYCIYTFVGDIVLALNPYMYIPRMVNILEYPNQKEFCSGKDPNVYSIAHAAYWNIRAPISGSSKNQSCIVSGESGAGKTVACSSILRYLAKLSDWRQLELNEKIGAANNITSLVTDVSPFLEAFGNAKTNMNDNSSRFGKFTRIWFSDGKIKGADIEHYLLEKARVCNHSSGERNYHIFYFLCRGATEDEISKLRLKPCEEFPALMHGGSANIGHGCGVDFDARQMNNPISKNDETGVRAALDSAHVTREDQSKLWAALAACLHMLSINFEMGNSDTQSVISKESADTSIFTSQLLGIDNDKFSKYLCIYRLKLPGGKFSDKDCTTDVAKDNRNACAKEIYSRIFSWLIDDVCNNILQPPEQDKDTFVGLLDIFGFEVMPRNSIEQLCINFANEKLQQLFNRHVFKSERKAYLEEGLNLADIPEPRDNTPCCDLVAGRGKKCLGIFKLLDDVCSKRDIKKNELVKAISKVFGDKKGVFEGAKSKVVRAASMNYFPSKKKRYTFNIEHYAGTICYDSRQFCAKNKDKLPPQLLDILKTSTNPFVSSLFNNRERKKTKKRGTLGSKYLSQLSNLAKTLKLTYPHYVRCVKPNDIHFRPIDGIGAFNAYKTYRQLLYSGIMEVVKLKREGFPFRMSYEPLWKLCVKFRYNESLNLPANSDPRESTEKIALAVLKKSFEVVDKVNKTKKQVPSWTLGNTMFFGKNNTLELLRDWHMVNVSSIIKNWLKFWLWQIRFTDFARSSLLIGTTYRNILIHRQNEKKLLEKKLLEKKLLEKKLLEQKLLEKKQRMEKEQRQREKILLEKKKSLENDNEKHREGAKSRKAKADNVPNTEDIDSLSLKQNLSIEKQNIESNQIKPEIFREDSALKFFVTELGMDPFLASSIHEKFPQVSTVDSKKADVVTSVMLNEGKMTSLDVIKIFTKQPSILCMPLDLVLKAAKHINHCRHFSIKTNDEKQKISRHKKTLLLRRLLYRHCKSSKHKRYILLMATSSINLRQFSSTLLQTSWDNYPNSFELRLLFLYFQDCCRIRKRILTWLEIFEVLRLEIEVGVNPFLEVR